jgi:hypothetical protein
MSASKFPFQAIVTKPYRYLGQNARCFLKQVWVPLLVSVALMGCETSNPALDVPYYDHTLDIAETTVVDGKGGQATIDLSRIETQSNWRIKSVGILDSKEMTTYHHTFELKHASDASLWVRTDEHLAKNSFEEWATDEFASFINRWHERNIVEKQSLRVHTAQARFGFGTAEYVTYAFKRRKCAVFRGVYGKQLSPPENKSGRESQIVGQVCYTRPTDKALEDSAKSLIWMIRLHTPGEPFWAPLVTPIEERSDVEVCRNAVYFPEGERAWDARQAGQKYVREARERNLSIEDCIRLIADE